LTSQQLAEYEQAAQDLDAVAIAAVIDLMDGMSLTQWQAFIDELMDSMPALVDELSDVSALLGVSAYDLSRSQSDARGRFDAAPAPVLPRARVQAMTRWALEPLFANAPSVTDAPLPDRLIVERVTDRLTSGTPRLVRTGERDTVWGNAGIDPVRPRYARLARPGACDFCKMLAGRGATYVSKESASVVGFDSEGRGPRTRKQRRGSQKVGSSFHDHCKCQPVALFPGDVVPARGEVELAG
jgi:hypothetical protein